MYWFRTENPLDFLIWLIVVAIWAVGGWLIATHAFRLKSQERIIVGFGLGLVSYLWFINLFGRWISPIWVFTGSAVLVLILGLAFSWKGERPVLDWKDLHSWRWILLGIFIVWIFSRIAKGMAIFDDRKNISIISTMAAGDIPPHHYMNSAVYFAYHYGFQLFGASMMRLGGLLPWSAFDLSKAIVGAYLFILAALLGKRYTGYKWAGFVVAGVLAFAAGTRYLLLLMPPSLMTQIDTLINVRSPDEVVGMPLSEALRLGIAMGDGPPTHLGYAFMNGIGWPAVMAVNAGPSTLSLVIMVMIWLTASRIRKPISFLVLTILFSMWALVWESSYGLVLLAGLIIGLYWLITGRKNFNDNFKWTLLAIVISAPIAVLQGGSITEIFRKIVIGLGSTSPAISEGLRTFGGFTFRWPPAVFSAHLDAMSIFSPLELLVAIFELGPVVLFAPLITWWSWKRLKEGDWILGILVLSAWIGFAIPIFLTYEYNRDIVRFTKHALVIWTIVLVIMLFYQTAKLRKNWQYLITAALVLMVFGGLVVFGSALTAAGQAVLSENVINGLDARVSSDTWDQLAPDSEVYDPHVWRATSLTGRLTHVVTGPMSYDYGLSPEWWALRTNPTIAGMINDGYHYVYIDQGWWADLPEEGRNELSQPCVVVITEYIDEERSQFRRLISLENCQPH
jgi:hypothetical protein